MTLLFEAVFNVVWRLGWLVLDEIFYYDCAYGAPSTSFLASEVFAISTAEMFVGYGLPELPFGTASPSAMLVPVLGLFWPSGGPTVAFFNDFWGADDVALAAFKRDGLALRGLLVWACLITSFSFEG